MPINYKLFKKVRKLFEKHPEKGDMGQWMYLSEAGYSRLSDAIDHKTPVKVCDTHLCIGGSAVVLSGKYTMRYVAGDIEIVNKATKKVMVDANINTLACLVLGISHEQGERLFYIHNWPQDLKTRDYHGAPGMLRRIDRFVETKGRE